MKPSKLTFATVKPAYRHLIWIDLDADMPHEVEDIRNGDGDLTYPALKLKGVSNWVAVEQFDLSKQPTAKPEKVEFLHGEHMSVAEVADRACSEPDPLMYLAEQVKCLSGALHDAIGSAQIHRLKREWQAYQIQEILNEGES